jgi:hypothetical protein
MLPILPIRTTLSHTLAPPPSPLSTSSASQPPSKSSTSPGSFPSSQSPSPPPSLPSCPPSPSYSSTPPHQVLRQRTWGIIVLVITPLQSRDKPNATPQELAFTTADVRSGWGHARGYAQAGDDGDLRRGSEQDLRGGEHGLLVGAGELRS